MAFAGENPPVSPFAKRLCRKDENAAFVILNEVKNLMHSIGYTAQILRLPPQNDIEGGLGRF